MEHLYAGAEGLPGEWAETAAQWVARQVARIDRGEVAPVVAECVAGVAGNGEHPLGQLGRYLEHQQGHLEYATAREQELPLGSGAVEGGHRHVIQARLKLPGTWWKEESVNPMLALRTLRANDWWGAFWN